MITERRKKSNRTKMLLWVLLGVAILGGAWILLQQSGSTPESVTVGDVTSGTAPTTRAAPKIDTSIFADERLFGEELVAGLEFTEQVDVTPFDADTPPSPVNIEVRNPGQGRRLVMVWEFPEGETVDGVNVYRMLSEFDQPALIGTVSADARLFDDRTVIDGREYYYLVKTFRRSGGSAGGDAQIVESQNTLRVRGTSTDNVPPNPPRNLAVTNVGDGTSADITWENPENDDFSFIRIYRSSREGEIGQLITTTDTLKGTSYTDQGLSSGVTYYYTVTAVDASGNESFGVLYRTPGRSNPFLPPSP